MTIVLLTSQELESMAATVISPIVDGAYQSRADLLPNPNNSINELGFCYSYDNSRQLQTLV